MNRELPALETPDNVHYLGAGQPVDPSLSFLTPEEHARHALLTADDYYRQEIGRQGRRCARAGALLIVAFLFAVVGQHAWAYVALGALALHTLNTLRGLIDHCRARASLHRRARAVVRR